MKLICISYQLRRHHYDHQKCHLTYNINITGGMFVVRITPCLVVEDTENVHGHLRMLMSIRRRDNEASRGSLQIGVVCDWQPTITTASVVSTDTS